MSPVRGSKTRRIRLVLEDGSQFCLYEKEVRRLGLSEGEDLPDEVYHKLVTEVLLPRAKRRALHLLEKQDRTRASLISKLTESGYPTEVIREAVAYVESFHYIDDDRYARNYIRYHQASKSRTRIKNDLLQRGVSREVIDAAMEEYVSSEAELIQTLLIKKHFDPERADDRERSRVFRFLLGRGFSLSDVKSALKF